MNLKRLVFIMVLAFTGFTLTWGQDVKINFEEYDLPNGLHVILSQDHSTPIVAVTVMYHVGSKNEKPDRTGFAHFFEHLMFEGSKYIPRGEYSKYVENAGGTLNANTSNDRTYFYELLPSNQLDLGLWLESERMMHLKVDSIGIETQRGVVKEEKKQRVDNAPYGTFLQEMLSHAYTKSPYRWPTIGSVAHLDAASYDEFMRFYKTYYVPNNAVLTIVGDINIDTTKAAVNTYFGGIPHGQYEIKRPDTSEPEKHTEVVDTVYDNIQLPAIFEGYHIPAMGDPDFYAVDMLNQLLSYGQSSRLYKSLVDEQQLALQVAAIPLPFEGPGLSIILAIPNIGVDPLKLEKAIDTQLDRVKDNLITEREFEKLRNQIESSFVSSNATIASRASNLATDYTFFHNTDLINTEINKYMAVTREDLQRVAKKYYRKGNRVVLYYLPKPKDQE
ncbi:MAG TPA: pitrilysin family protein [Bacteroidales bacterium]|nr:pitrilysin family protein [Bacteroidales bacterium]